MTTQFKIKSIVFAVFALFFNSTAAQNKAFLDFIVTSSNDTIYGVFRDSKLVEINSPQKNTATHNLDNVKSLRQNDIIYNRVSTKLKKNKSVVLKPFNSDFISIRNRQPDFIKNHNRDTVFGFIKSPVFGRRYLKKNDNTTVKIDKKNTKSYKINHTIYDLKTLDSTIVSIEKKVFLKRLIKGKLSLYEYRILRNDAGGVSPKTFYMVEKEGQLFIIPNSNYKQSLIEIFIENSTLVDLIDDEFYRLENLYLIVKYYNFKSVR